MLDSLSKFIRRYFNEKIIFNDNIFKTQTDNFKKVIFIIRVYYFLSIFISLSVMSWMLPMLLESSYLAPLWVIPDFMTNNINYFAPMLFISWIFGSFLSTFKPWKFSFRLLHAIGIFYIIALFNSDGQIGNNRHAYLWISIYLLILPNIKPTASLSRKNKNKFLITFWGAQLTICTFYFISGVWKVYGIIECLLRPGLTCEISKNILTNISAHEYIMFDSFAPLRFLIFNYPYIGLFSYLFVIWFHLSAFYFCFRLNSHRLYGVILAIFHIGNFLLFGVNFTPMIAIVSVLFIASPFSNTNSSLFKMLSRFPLISFIYNFLSFKKRYSLLQTTNFAHYKIITIYSILTYLACRKTAWVWEPLYKELQSGSFNTSLVTSNFISHFSINFSLYTFVLSCICITLFYKSTIANIIYILALLPYLLISVEYQKWTTTFLYFIPPIFLFSHFFAKTYKKYLFFLFHLIIQIVLFTAISKLSLPNFIYLVLLSFTLLINYFNKNLLLPFLILVSIIGCIDFNFNPHIILLLLFFYIIMYNFDFNNEKVLK